MQYLYSIPLQEASSTNQQQRLAALLAEQPTLESNAAVEQLGTQAGDVSLSGQFRFGSPFAEQIATELEELADSNMAALGLFRSGDSAAAAALDGYYEIAEADTNPAHAASEDVYEYELSLTKAGTRNTEWLAIATHPTQPDPGHEFGNDETASIGIPAAASKIQAVDAAIGPSERVRPEPVATYPSEFGGVEVYDALDMPFDDPIFLYDLPYAEAAKHDVKVYDTLGDDEKYLLDVTGQRVRQWQHVFNSAHDPVGEFVLDNGLLRVRLDEEGGTITAEGFDDGSYGSGPYGAGPYGGYEDPENADVWHDVTLPATEWSLLDVDLTHISPVRAEAQLEFEHDTEGVSAVDVHLDRGMPLLRVWAPETVTDPIPQGLADLFDPIASSSTWDPGHRQTLIAREEVRF